MFARFRPHVTFANAMSPRSERRTRESWIGLPVVCVVSALAFAVPTSAGAADRVYWGNTLNTATTPISFANLDGSGGGTLKTAGAPVARPQGVAIDTATGRIYWANFASNTTPISWANLNGSGGGKLNIAGATANGIEGVAIDPVTRRIYWANANGTPNSISYANLNGSGGGKLKTTGAPVDGPAGVAIDPVGRRIYWANDNPMVPISYAKLDGSGGGKLTHFAGASPNEPEGVALDLSANRVYWANDGNTTVDRVSYAKLDGSGGGNLSTTASAPGNALGVAIDRTAGRFYWGNAGSNAHPIGVSTLAGPGGGDLNTGGATANGAGYPVLLEHPRGTAPPLVTGPSVASAGLACSRDSWAGDLVAAFLYRAPQTFAYRWSRNEASIPFAASSSYTAKLAGAYRCRVTASNAAGAASQTSAPHYVFARAKIRKAKVKRRKRRARFSFKQSGGGTGFQCALVRKHTHAKAKFKSCRSPKTYRHLKRGKYKFEVRVRSPGGAGPAAKKRFKI